MQCWLQGPRQWSVTVASTHKCRCGTARRVVVRPDSCSCRRTPGPPGPARKADAAVVRDGCTIRLQPQSGDGPSLRCLVQSRLWVRRLFHTSETLLLKGGGSPQLYYHDCSGTEFQVTVQGHAAVLLPRLFGNRIPGHTTRAPPVGFELATNGIQFYAIANLDNTSLPSRAAGSSARLPKHALRLGVTLPLTAPQLCTRLVRLYLSCVLHSSQTVTFVCVNLPSLIGLDGAALCP